MNLTVEEILKATGGKLLQGNGRTLFQGVSTDSRTIGEGELFIALKGTHFDGHHFAMDALKKRAGGILIEEDKAGDIRLNDHRSKTIIVVKDTLSALGDIAHEWRCKHHTPIMGLTGSNGKTTTKEMIAACLETTFPILKTEGNLNNLIGVPLTLLRLTEKERIVVLEMGMNMPGEIRRLTEIVEPDVGLITNIQKAHLEGMKNLETLKEEKGELFRRMRKNGTILVNQDDPLVVDLARPYPGQKITFGVERYAEVMAREVQLRGGEGTSFTLLMEGEAVEIHLRVLGRHFVSNALSAIATACLFGIEIKQVKEALERFRPFPMRMEVIPLKDGGNLINDAYNANPHSVELALETLSEVKRGGRAFAVLGDMLELGDFSQEAHEQIGKKVSKLSIDFLLVLGDKAPLIVESAIRYGFPEERTRVLENHSEAISILRQMIQGGDWILVKGSRKMAMEKIVEGLTERRT